MLSVHEHAGATGALRMCWHTHETNLDVVHLYDQVGERRGFIAFRTAM